MPAVKDAVDIACAVAVVAAATTASGHAVLYKRDSRSAAIWLLLIWVLPALGALAYALLGVNRGERRAARMRRRMVRHRDDPQFPAGEPGTHFVPLARLVSQIVEPPPLSGKRVRSLLN